MMLSMTYTLHIANMFTHNFLGVTLCGVSAADRVNHAGHWFAFKWEEANCHACLDMFIRFADLAAERIIELDKSAANASEAEGPSKGNDEAPQPGSSPGGRSE